MTNVLAMKRFLVAVDGAGLSDHAAHAAAALAAPLGAELELVHAVDVPPVLWMRVPREDLAEMHRTALDRSRAAVVAHLEGVERQHALDPGSLSRHLVVFPGRPGRVLVDRARETEASVVFVGPHTQRRLLDFGSTTRAVLHHAEGGVWLQAGPFRPIETILAPVDLSDESELVLGTARAMAEHTGAEVIVLHCLAQPVLAPPLAQAEALGWPVPGMEELRTEARRGLEGLVGSLDWGGVPHRLVLSADPPQVAIHAMQDRAQLVVLGTRGPGGLSRLLLGSVAYGVLKDARAGVLAIRQREPAG